MAKTILVVDDETVIVEITRRKLQEMGFEVTTAYNGEDALARLKEKVPDLIIL